MIFIMIFYQKKAGLFRPLTSILFVTAPVFSRCDITFETLDSARRWIFCPIF
jgi:hypothetical protein